jgi:hypothetical protein
MNAVHHVRVLYRTRRIPDPKVIRKGSIVMEPALTMPDASARGRLWRGVPLSGTKPKVGAVTSKSVANVCLAGTRQLSFAWDDAKNAKLTKERGIGSKTWSSTLSAATC